MLAKIQYVKPDELATELNRLDNWYNLLLIHIEDARPASNMLNNKESSMLAESRPGQTHKPGCNLQNMC